MYLDVVELRNFYSSALGMVTSRLIRDKLRSFWANAEGQKMLGLGYAIPFLEPFFDEADRVISLMPSAQGVVRWPREGLNRAALSDETQLPLPDASFDRVVLVHILENSSELTRLLREVWRVVAPAGRVILIVPNRRGIWARLDRTPFGHGRPYSKSQLLRLLGDSMFTPLQWSSALFMPPSENRLMLRGLHGLERFGERIWKNFAGVLMVEAEKRIYAAPTEPAKARVKSPALNAN